MRTHVTRWTAIGLAAVVAVSCSAGDADPIEYFAELDRLQSEMDAVLEEAWQSPLALEVEALDFEGLSPELTADEDALVKEFISGFWVSVFDAAGEHRGHVADLDVPDSVEEEHDGYIEAVDAFLGQRDRIVQSVEEDSGLELLEGFWEPVPEVDAIDQACVRLKDAAASLEIAIAAPLCTD